MRTASCVKQGPRSALRLALSLVAMLAVGLAACGSTVTEATPPPAASTPAAAGPSATPPPKTAAAITAPASASSACLPTDQDRYVYHPSRLAVKAACRRVSGVIEAIRTEADGDLHILLRLDGPYRSLLRPANAGKELGDLVVEPICVQAVSQADAIGPCAADPDPLQNLPQAGMRVWMEGRYVLDLDHGGWAELHPLYRWGTGSTSAAPASTPRPTGGSVTAGSGLVVRFTSVPSPAPIGGSATIAARTSAGATCSIAVTLRSGRVSTVAVLQTPEIADGSGNVSWTWSIRSNTTPGTASAVIRCVLGSKAGSARTTFAMR